MLALLSLAMAAQGACPCCGGGVSYDLLADPAFDGMMSQYQQLMGKGPSPYPSLPEKEMAPATLAGNWTLQMEGGILGELSLIEVGSVAFGHGILTRGGLKTEITAFATLKDDGIEMELVPAGGGDLYRLGLNIQGGEGDFQAFTAQGRSLSGWARSYHRD